mmetsp:Transcript_27689/g.40775  ORF Transcript_27689/g.40775 Transcript_27689/m.40775 type:complete len:247 (-) Transcript_27689:796-1536(-)
MLLIYLSFPQFPMRLICLLPLYLLLLRSLMHALPQTSSLPLLFLHLSFHLPPLITLHLARSFFLICSSPLYQIYLLSLFVPLLLFLYLPRVVLFPLPLSFSLLQIIVPLNQLSLWPLPFSLLVYYSPPLLFPLPRYFPLLLLFPLSSQHYAFPLLQPSLPPLLQFSPRHLFSPLLQLSFPRSLYFPLLHTSPQPLYHQLQLSLPQQSFPLLHLSPQPPSFVFQDPLPPLFFPLIQFSVPPLSLPPI